ncbi:hypothetical protein TH1_06655 [Thalassospira lucentensis MCCC 1A00383 = DSM 14000]|nr:hypothetical protein TH1_06655 [Thalassospira lucentensis MCCC 1A00383 = DSM 14000]
MSSNPRFSKIGDKVVALDMCYNGKTAPLFLKQNLPDALEKSKSGLLYFDRKEVSKRVRAKFRCVKREKSVAPSGCSLSNLCGHKLFFVFTQFCKVIARRISRKVNSVSDNAIRNSLIELFKLLADHTVQQHYKSSLTSI